MYLFYKPPNYLSQYMVKSIIAVYHYIWIRENIVYKYIKIHKCLKTLWWIDLIFEYVRRSLAMNEILWAKKKRYAEIISNVWVHKDLQRDIKDLQLHIYL